MRGLSLPWIEFSFPYILFITFFVYKIKLVTMADSISLNVVHSSDKNSALLSDFQHQIAQGVYMTLNDLKFDLVTPKNHTVYKMWTKWPWKSRKLSSRDILIQWKFTELYPQAKETALMSEIFGSINGIRRWLISQNT